MSRVIRVNRVECKKCGDVITSRHRHDFISCKCGAIFTDGGVDYIRRGGNPDEMIDRSVFEEMSDYGTTQVGTKGET